MSWTHLFSKVGFGRVLGGFWEEIWWIFKVADHFVDSYFALEFWLDLCGMFGVDSYFAMWKKF